MAAIRWEEGGRWEVVNIQAGNSSSLSSRAHFSMDSTLLLHNSPSSCSHRLQQLLQPQKRQQFLPQQQSPLQYGQYPAPPQQPQQLQPQAATVAPTTEKATVPPSAAEPTSVWTVPCSSTT